VLPARRRMSRAAMLTVGAKRCKGQPAIRKGPPRRPGRRGAPVAPVATSGWRRAGDGADRPAGGGGCVPSGPLPATDTGGAGGW